MRYLNTDHEIYRPSPPETSATQRKNIVVELGAGTGLCGIFISKIFDNSLVYITDRKSQISLIEDNIRLNSDYLDAEKNTFSKASSSSTLSSEVRMMTAAPSIKDSSLISGPTSLAFELDWQSQTDILSFKTQIAESRIDLILAADVLYDHNLSRALFALIEQLQIDSKTRILIAQKLRGDDSHQQVTSSYVENRLDQYCITRVWEEARVVVWCLQRLPRKIECGEQFTID